MHTPFTGSIPDHLLYNIEWNMWVRRDPESVVVGATSYGIFLAGNVIAFTAKPRGARVERGRSLGTVECAKTVLAVHAPVGFVLDEANEALEHTPQQLLEDPYAAWMVRGTPLDWPADAATLVDALTYRAYVVACETGRGGS